MIETYISAGKIVIYFFVSLEQDNETFLKAIVGQDCKKPTFSFEKLRFFAMGEAGIHFAAKMSSVSFIEGSRIAQKSG